MNVVQFVADFHQLPHRFMFSDQNSHIDRHYHLISVPHWCILSSLSSDSFWCGNLILPEKRRPGNTFFVLPGSFFQFLERLVRQAWICITGLLYVPLIRGPSSFREKKQKRRPAGREKEDG